MFRRELPASPFLIAVSMTLLVSITMPVNGNAKIAPALCNVNYESQTSIDWVCKTHSERRNA